MSSSRLNGNLKTEIFAETKAALAEIDANIRAAAVAAPYIIVGRNIIVDPKG